VNRDAAAAARETAPVGREVAIGDVLRGRYRIRGMLGRGAKSTVFEALDEYRLDLATMDQRLAIKVLNAGVTQRQDLLSELQREFQYLQLLSHPNIVRVNEFDRDGDTAFFTMELLNGALLSRVLSARNGIALPRAFALAVIRDIGAALAHAHSRGVVHGDINPQNILLTTDGELRVLDFSASHKLLPDSWSTDHEFSQRAPVATPAYASCQLLDGQQPDARDDLFALASVAYVLLSGRHPFPNRTAVDARTEGFRPRKPPELDGRQWRVLREGLRWERERRPADVQKWLDRFNLAGAAPRLPALAVLVSLPPPRRRKIAMAASVLVTIALLAAGVYWGKTDYDSLKRQVSGWSDRLRSALDNAPGNAPAEVPAMPAPAAAGRTPRAAVTRDAPRPSGVTRTAPATAEAPATGAAAPAPAPNPAASPAATLRSQAAPAPAARSYAGPIRVEMASDTVDVEAADTIARVVVRRRGNSRGDASFTWWTESGTAKPERDFAPVMPRAERIEDGSGSVILNIPVSGRPRTEPKSFYVVIDRTDSGAALGARTLTMVTLQPPN
jgi:serine/threonine protein kinase